MSPFDESKMRALVNVGTQRPSPPKPKKRAIDIFHATVSEYNLIKAQVKQDQIANLFCLVGDKSYDVFQISADDDLIKISAKDENGNFHRLVFPFEQAAFDIVVSKKTKENEGWGVKFMGFEPQKTEK
jgi:hypothetical protein